MKCMDQIVVPMIRPPLASAKLDSQESRSASYDPDVSASAVSDPTIATPIDSNTRKGSYVTTIAFSPASYLNLCMDSKSRMFACARISHDRFKIGYRLFYAPFNSKRWRE